MAENGITRDSKYLWFYFKIDPSQEGCRTIITQFPECVCQRLWTLPARCIVSLPMKYLEEKTIARLNLISLLLIIALLSLGMGFLFISGYNDVFKSELKKVEEDYIFLRKEKIKNVIDLKVADIETRDEKILDILKENLKKQVFAAHNIS
ncbi:MAG: hypothetical protein ABIK68_01860, partial [bacterium]